MRRAARRRQATDIDDIFAAHSLYCAGAIPFGLTDEILIRL
jgi:hypothetical protein